MARATALSGGQPTARLPGGQPVAGLPDQRPAAVGGRGELAVLLGDRHIRLALLVLAIANLAMVGVMAVAPVHLQHHSAGIGSTRTLPLSSRSGGRRVSPALFPRFTGPLAQRQAPRTPPPSRRS